MKREFYEECCFELPYLAHYNMFIYETYTCIFIGICNNIPINKFKPNSEESSCTLINFNRLIENKEKKISRRFMFAFNMSNICG
jgi:hypothetical protein